MLEVIKSSLGEHNKGRCSSRNNARFTGSTVCWVIRDTSGSFLDGEDWIAVSRKRDAVALCEHFNRFDEDVWNVSGVDTFVRDHVDAGTLENWMLDIKEV